MSIWNLDLEQLTLSSLDAPADALTPDGKLGVREGSRVEIFCRKPNGFPIPLIYWEDPSGKRMSETVTNDTRDLSLLLIEKIQSSQAGGYSCVAQNPAAITRIIVEIVITCNSYFDENFYFSIQHAFKKRTPFTTSWLLLCMQW